MHDAGMDAQTVRLIENMIKVGEVVEIDADQVPPRVRVACGDTLTDWIPWVSMRAGAVKVWQPPSIGERVVLLSPGGDPARGIALPSIFCDEMATPETSLAKTVTLYPDGARIEYDHEAKALTATLPGTATIRAQGAVSVSCQSPVTVAAPAGITLTGPVTINGALHVTQGVVTDADAVASGVSLINHTHGGVQNGLGSTGAPQ